MSDISTDFNDTRPAAAVTDYNFPALIFGILLIVIITGGNVLVCLSVYLEKALKTTTNYFIVSLAFADLLLAVLVLPLFVYAEVSYRSRHVPSGPGGPSLYYVLYCLISAVTVQQQVRTKSEFSRRPTAASESSNQIKRRTSKRTGNTQNSHKVIK